MDPLHEIAESRIREALERGELADLPGRGRPIALEDLRGVPRDLRMGFLILKRAGVLPEELEVRKEFLRLQDLIDACDDAEEAAALRRIASEKALRWRILLERRLHGPALIRYGSRIRRRLGL